MMGEAIAFAAFIGNGKTIFFPSLVEKRKYAVMKEVEKIAKSLITRAQARQNQRGVEMRERALRARDAHEVDRERRRLSFRPINRLNFAGGKRERGIRAKTRDFIGRIGK